MSLLYNIILQYHENIHIKDKAVVKMKIHSRICAKLRSMSKDKVVKRMGYDSTKRGLKTLETFLMHEDIYDWIEDGYYDFEYTAVQFLSKLCDVLDIDAKTVEYELERDRRLSQAAEKFRSTYIFVNTTNSKISLPAEVSITMDYFDDMKILRRPYLVEMIDRTDKEIFILISNIIKEHYADSNGRIFPWGDIVNYTYYHNDNKAYLFDIDGNQIENIDVAGS